MKLVALNIRHGGGSRSAGILGWIRDQAPDFILLTEWRKSAKGLVLQGAIQTLGYSVVGGSDGASSNGLLVASTRPFRTIDLTPIASATGKILAADLEIGIRVLCCYFPQLGVKKPFFEVCLEQAAQLETPMLILGDLNTGSNDYDLEQGATKFSCADQFGALTHPATMTDLWRYSNGPHAREWSWRSSKNGFRIDHALGNRSLVRSFGEIKCRYDHSTRDNVLTDHSGLILEIGNRASYKQSELLPA